MLVPELMSPAPWEQVGLWLLVENRYLKSIDAVEPPFRLYLSMEMLLPPLTSFHTSPDALLLSLENCSSRTLV